jgi:putative effector of murein hydrolase LrgA (UPF0299 family)
MKPIPSLLCGLFALLTALTDNIITTTNVENGYNRLILE